VVGGGWLTSRPVCFTPWGRRPTSPVPVWYEALWASKLVWITWKREIPLLLLLFIYGTGVEPSSLILRPLLAFCFSPGWKMEMIVEQLVEKMGDRWNWNSQRKTTRVPLCPPDDIWLEPGWNSDHRVEKPGTNCLSYGTAHFFILLGPELRPLGHPANSLSLYRLRHRSSLKIIPC
jgi:hypothetical protein